MRKLLNMVLAATLIVVSLVTADVHAQWVSYAPLSVNVTNASRTVVPAVEGRGNGTNVWATGTAYTRDTYIWNYNGSTTTKQYLVFNAGTSTSAVPPTATDGDDQTSDSGLVYRRARRQRNGLALCNLSTTTMYIAFGRTNTAVLLKGIAIEAGETLTIQKPSPVPLGEIKAVCGSGVAEIMTTQEW